VKGHKLPKSGVQLHNGEYSSDDIKLLREHGEYEEMRAFRNQHNVGRSTNAVATSDRQDGDAASLAGQSVRSSGTRSHLSCDTESLRSNDRGNAMVVTGRPRMVAIPGPHESSGHRNIDNTPSWMRNPTFVSESHATKSRQSTTTKSLGLRWQAPTSSTTENRVVDAVARTTPTVAKPLAKPRKAVAKPTAQKDAPKKAPPTVPKKVSTTIKDLVDYSSSSDDSSIVHAWGRPTAPVVAVPVPPIVVVAAPLLPIRTATAAPAAANAATSTVAASAPTDAAVAGSARPESPDSLFDTEDDDSVKEKHHVSIADLLAKLDPKVPKTATATTRKRKAVAEESPDTDSSVASCDKKPVAKAKKASATPRTAPTRKRAAPDSYKPIVARKSKPGNKKA
jgi:hypothetical protein